MPEIAIRASDLEQAGFLGCLLEIKGLVFLACCGSESYFYIWSGHCPTYIFSLSSSTYYNHTFLPITFLKLLLSRLPKINFAKPNGQLWPSFNLIYQHFTVDPFLFLETFSSLGSYDTLFIFPSHSPLVGPPFLSSSLCRIVPVLSPWSSSFFQFFIHTHCNDSKYYLYSNDSYIFISSPYLCLLLQNHTSQPTTTISWLLSVSNSIISRTEILILPFKLALP